MKGILLSIILFFLCLSIYAQDPFNILYRTDLDSSFGTIFSGVIATDSAYYLTGLTVDIYPKLHNVGLFVKMDLNGKKLIQRTYGDTLLTHEMWDNGFQQTNDGNFINTASNRDGSFSLIKFRPNGEPLFIKNFYPSPEGYGLYTRGGIAPTKDQGWMLVVTEWRKNKNSVIVAIKTDSMGNEITRREYDDPQYERSGAMVLSEADGGFIISSRRDKGGGTNYISHTHIFKIDSLGDPIWNYLTPYPLSRKIAATYMKRANDGGLVLAGAEGFQVIDGPNISYDYLGYVLKLNHLRQFQWEKTFGADFPNFFTFNTDIKLQDGDVYLLGQTFTNDTTEVVGWLTRINEKNGIIKYQRYYTRNHIPSTIEYRILGSMSQTSDGGFILTGYIWNKEHLTKQEGYWGWVVKTDSLGCIEPGCLSVGIGDAPIADEGLIITAYPNPASDQIRFQLDYPEGVLRRAFLSLSVYNMLGQKMEERPLGRGESMVELPLQLYPAGVYVYRLTEEGRLLGGGKFVKQ